MHADNDSCLATSAVLLVAATATAYGHARPGVDRCGASS